ncbi:MAG: DUF2620 domain-containing protein [Sporolactobacillus sp.]|jgi:hypothetical protein|nr:DUF2620 domain-containing protein [Sporolactobacillus sp.]
MVRIVVGGQMAKAEIAESIKELTKGQIVEITVKNDLDAAMAVKNGEADYYIGACETGAGGALAMATALLGSNKTVTVASPSRILNEPDIKKCVEGGKVAFGFTVNTKNTILPVLMKYLLK